MEGSVSGLIKYNSYLNESANKNNNSTSFQEGIDLSKKDDIIEFKVVLIGSTSVGKTSLFNKFIPGDFSQNYKSTIIVEYLIYSFFTLIYLWI